MDTLQHMFNQRFLDVARNRPSFLDSNGIARSWDEYMAKLEQFGVARGGWFKGLFRRGDVRLIDPVTLDQYADWSETTLVPPHVLLNIIGRVGRTIFVPREFAEKVLVLGSLPT